MTLHEIVLRNHDKVQLYNQSFVQKFSVSMQRFWNPLLGFDLVKFDGWLRTPDGVSTKEHITNKYGQDAADLIESIIKR